MWHVLFGNIAWCCKVIVMTSVFSRSKELWYIWWLSKQVRLSIWLPPKLISCRKHHILEKGSTVLLLLPLLWHAQGVTPPPPLDSKIGWKKIFFFFFLAKKSILKKSDFLKEKSDFLRLFQIFQDFVSQDWAGLENSGLIAYS